ncbi:MAG: LysM peptidoglycan-binding domain-containing protein, partial [Chloroflexi bacterium]|nr:LysM peptidoglycan-binding domain-containing protein [Chloroflexota bacterium]
MSSKQAKSVVIGGRELTLLAIALAILAVAATIFAIGLSTFNNRQGFAAAPLPPTPTVGPTFPPIDPLPSATPSPVVADLPDAPQEEVGTEIEIIQHVVVPGDTLVSIAEEYGAVLQDVLAANSFT